MKFNFIISILVIFIILFSFLSILQFKENLSLKKQLNYTQQKLDEAKKIKKEWENFQKELAEYNNKQKLIEKKVPKNEKVPLKLMKKIALLGLKHKLKDMEFKYEEEDKVSFEGTSQGVESSFEDKKNFSLSQTGSQNVFGSEFSQQTTTSQKEISIKSLSFQIYCKGDFFNLISFLKDILKLERITLIKSIKIKRKEEILPYQSITMDLVTYTFTDLNQNE